MNWGIMFSRLNRSAKAKGTRAKRTRATWVVSCLLFFWSVSAWCGGYPYSSSELHAVETSEEGKIRDLENEEVTQLRIALGRRSGPNRLADLYFRLAEIYMETYHTQFLLEGRAHEKRLEKGIEDKFIDRSHSKPYLYLGIKACLEVVGFRISYIHLDQVYYFLGFNYSELEDRANSAKYYSYLVQYYPNSQFAGVALKELAEYSYKNADFRKAVGYFERAKQKMPSENWPPLLHRLAWAYYRTKQFDHSIAVMKETIAACDEQPAKYTPLREEALQDLATLLAEGGRVEEAINYFEHVAGDKDYFPRILEKLGRQYERNVEIPKAIAAYESLLKLRPESDAAFRVFAKLIELDLKEKHFSNALSRLKGLHVPSGGDADTQATAQNLRVMIRKTATDHHQDYRKKKSDDAHVNHLHLEVAESFYSAYLTYFLKVSDPHHETTEIEMYLAEVKRDLGKSNDVVELYRSVVKSKDSKYAKEAGLLWISSLFEAMKKAPQRSSDSLGPSELEKEFLDAADTLMSSLEETNEAKEVSIRAAQVQAGYASTRADAVARIKAIIAHWPRSPQALTGAQLWIQLCQDTKSQPQGAVELEAAFSEIKGNLDLMAADQAINKGKLRTILNDQETRVKVGNVAKKEHDKDFIGAAKGYEDFARESNDRNFVEKAYSTAISMYQKANTGFEPILALIETWQKRYPRSPKIQDPLRAIATIALIQGDFEFSARIFDKLGTDFRDSASLETSARIYEGVGDLARAQHQWTLFLELFKDSPERWAVALSLARSQEQSHMDGEANRSYRYCGSGPPAFQAECSCRLADLYLRDKDVAQAKLLFQRVASQGQGQASEEGQTQGKSKGHRKKAKQIHPHSTPVRHAGGVSPFVGYARYQLAVLAEEEARFDPLKFPEKQLQKGLNQRLNFLEPLSHAYQSVVEVGGPWSIAALNRLALWAMHFADEVDGIEAPASLQGASLEKFKKDLTSISGPLRERAKSTWNECYNKAASINLLSPVLPEVADHLADFHVSVPARAQGPRGKFHLAGVAAEGGAEGAVIAFQKVRERLLQNVKDEAAWMDYGNLLWGTGKPLMAKVAYERALSLNPRNVTTLNNLAVVTMSSEGEEDWIAAAEGIHLLEEALALDDFYVPAKVNLATLLNYYRIFAKSKLLWDQVLVRNPSSTVSLDAEEGLAVALQGLSSVAAAEMSFKKVSDSGTGKQGFAYVYNEAARYSMKGSEEAGRCVSTVEDLDMTKLVGFEKTSAEYLKGKCAAWRK